MINFTDNPAGIPPLGFTHGGRFHADDVFSSALLKILRPDIRIYRGFVIPKGFSGVVFDIGDGPFDHHAKNSPKRENGVPYAAFGLLWQVYGHHLLDADEARRFDEKFVQPLDLDDNTGCGNVLAGLINAFNPVWDSQDDADKAFEEAVAVAVQLLQHKFESTLAIGRGRQLAEKHLRQMKDKIVVLPVYVPWKPVLIPSEAEFVVFPTQRGGYTAQCVPKDFNGKTGNKIPMPALWRAKPAEELARITGVADMKFCHASGFMVTADSLESAIKLCQLAQADWARRLEQSEKDKAAIEKASI